MPLKALTRHHCSIRGERDPFPPSLSQTSYTSGGTLDFSFANFGSRSVTVSQLRVRDVTSTGGAVRVYRGRTLLKTLSVPRTGPGSSRTLVLNVAGADHVKVTLTGSGAIDDLIFSQ